MFKLADMVIDTASDVTNKKLSGIIDRGLAKAFTDWNNKKQEVPKWAVDIIHRINLADHGTLKLMDDDQFALIYIDKDGTKHRRFPLVDMGNAIISAMYFLDSYKSLSSEAAAVACKGIALFLENNRRLSRSLGGNTASDTELNNLASLADKLEDRLYQLEDKKGLAANRGRWRDDGSYNNVVKEVEEEKSPLQGNITRNIKEARAHLADRDFVFVTHNEGQKHRLFPVSNKEEVVKIANYFVENEGKYELEYKYAFAKKLRDKASEYDVVIPESVYKYASYEWHPDAQSAVRARIDMLSNFAPKYNEKTGGYEMASTNNKDKDESLVALIKLSSMIGHIDIDDFATALHAVDKVAGLDRAYGKTLTNAYESVYFPVSPKLFSTVKTASEKVDFVQYNEQKIPVSKLLNLKLAQVSGVIDSDTLSELHKDPVSVFKSLPTPYKSAIIQAIS